jgi:hypothetical protein
MGGRRRGRFQRGFEWQRNRPRQQVQPPLAPAVNRVAEHGAAELGAVNPDLVRAAGLGVQFEPGQAPALAHHAPLCARGLARRVDHHAPTATPGAFQQPGIHDSLRLRRDAPDDRPIRLARRPARERRLGAQQRFPAERDHQAARRIGVEPVREPGAGLAPGEFAEPVLNAGAAARPGMDRQARRLVQDHELGGTHEDGRRHRARLTAAGPRRKHAHAR